MLVKVSIVSSILMLIFMEQSVLSQPAYAQEGPRPQVLKADEMTKAELRKQFSTLPDSAVIEFKGKRATVGEIRSKMQQSPKAKETAKLVSERAKTAADRTAAEVEARRVQSLAQRQAALADSIAKAKAEFTRIQAASEAIEEEGRRLARQYRTATPSEKEQLDRRASELLQQLGLQPR